MLSKIDPFLRGAGRLAVDAVPQLEEPLRNARGVYAHAYVSAVAARHNLTHEAEIAPYELVEVPPEQIRRVTEPMPVPRFRRLGVIEGGDWDDREEYFRETDVFRAFEAHFEDGVPWAETAFFDRVLGEIEDGRAPWGCRSRDELEARCERLEELYETIREDGYRTQRELLAGEADDPIGSRRTAPRARLINDEIAVDVGRDGEILFADGRNRLAIAILLDLDAVPVLVLRRHERWQALRDEVARRRREDGILPDVARLHPDLPGPTDAERVDTDLSDADLPDDNLSDDDLSNRAQRRTSRSGNRSSGDASDREPSEVQPARTQSRDADSRNAGRNDADD